MLTKMPPIVLSTIEFNTPNTINNLRITVTTIARIRLDIGPASAVNIIPFLLSLKVLSSTDTGFPQPTPIRIIDRKPIGSICAKGLRVNLPFIFWLISPSLYATHACAYSCIDRDSKRAGNVYKNVINPSLEKISNNYNHSSLKTIYYYILYSLILQEISNHYVKHFAEFSIII